MTCKRDYLPVAIFEGNNLEALCFKIAQAIRESKVRFSAIAFQGMSGAMVAPMVASLLRKKLILVRKKGVLGSHSPYTVEGYLESKTYIILDDFTESGETCRNIMESVKNCNAEEKSKPQCRGIFVYEPRSNCYTEVEGVKVRRIV